jgi:hypothetical protein
LPLSSLASGPSLTGAISGLVNGLTSSLRSTVQQVVAPSHSTGTIARSSTPSVAPSVSSPSASSGSAYTPPMYGTNPHGQGTVAGVDLNPSSSVPYTYAPGGSTGEALVLGRGRSEQNSNGTYDAQMTIVGLLGDDLIPEKANEGQSMTGPLNSVQTGVLDGLCNGTSMAICLTVLASDASATSTGAKTHFELAGVNSKQILGLSTGIATSDSSISTSGTCQVASGDSSAANIAIATGDVASVGKSSESSSACAGTTPTQTASSAVIGLGGTGVGIPAAGCANGTPNTSGGIPSLLPIYCNADSTTQSGSPSGVREGLTVQVLDPLIQVATPSSESHAVAPKASTSPTKPTTPSKPSGGNGNGNGNKGKGNGNGNNGSCTTGSCPSNSTGASGPSGAGANNGNQVTSLKSNAGLPFTGENVLEVLLVGLILAAIGLSVGLVNGDGRKRSQPSS